MDTKTVLKASRYVTKLVVQYSVSTAVSGALIAVAPRSKATEKAAALVAGYVIGAMTAEKASVYIDKQFDAIEITLQKFEKTPSTNS